MIVPMKKVSLVILKKESKSSLRSLRKAGVLHLEKTPGGSGENLESLIEINNRVSSALAKLDTSIKPENWDGAFNRSEALESVDAVLKIDSRIKELHSSISKISIQADMLKPYGEFEPADLAILRSKGIDIRLYEGDNTLMESVRKSGGTVFVLKRSKKTYFFAAVFSGDAPAKAIELSYQLPEYGVIELASIKEALKSELARLQKELARYSARKPVIEHLLASIEQNLEFEALSTGIDNEEELTWVTGFIPEDEISELTALAAAEGWGLLIREPDIDDPIPTLVKNGARIRIIQPVFDFLGTLPGYREYDISLYFLAYFSIFFAMIIGDAGYGAIFLLAALFLTFKSLKKPGGLPDAVKLLYVLSIATIIWGTITGNWFGSKAIASVPLLKNLTVPTIATFPDLFPEVKSDPQKAVMWLCFLLGLTQLTLANVMNFIRDFPGLKAYSHLGWGAVIGGLYFLVLNLVIGTVMPPFAVIMVAAGFGLIVLFGEQGPGVGFLKGIVKGVGGAFTTFLNAISGFSNIISYIRLFAVGMSSFYIASSFNNLAAPMLEGWTFPLGIIVIAIGHGLNLIMAMLSVVVHGIRLNMLEFSGQLGMEWTGIEYNPFRVRISEENNNQGVPS